MITIRIEGEQGVARKLKQLYKQLPFAAAKALTLTAKAAQDEILRAMPRFIDRPTPYTLNSTYVKPATKDRLEAEVGFRDSSPKGTPAFKYLTPEVYGGRRRVKRFELALRAIGVLPPGMFAMQGEGARIDAHGNMSPRQIEQILSALRASRDPYQNRPGGRRTLYFAVRPGGRLWPGIYMRAGATGSAVLPVLIFAREPSYRSRFPFYSIVLERVEHEFEAQLAKAIDGAIATAR